MQTSVIKLDSIFSGGFVTIRSQPTLEGYQQSLGDFITSAQASNVRTETCKPISVDLSKAAVDQLWEEVKAVMRFATLRMMPFLWLFVMETGNGLSLFAIDIETPAELAELIKNYLKYHKRDPRGEGGYASDKESSKEYECEDSKEEDKEMGGEKGSGGEVITDHMQDIVLEDGKDNGANALTPAGATF